MLQVGPNKTGFQDSLAYPISGTGLLLIGTLTMGLGLIRFMVWLMTNNVVALSTAMAVIFVLLGAAYVARYMTAATEQSAEGYDLAPGLPDPREVEELFGSLLSLVVVLFFSLLPVGLASIFGLRVGVVTYVLLGFGALYFPMGFLGATVKGDLSGSFPGGVFTGIAAVALRYVPAAVFCGAGGVLIVMSMFGGLADTPLVVRIGLDAVASWLLVASLHRVGVLHREEIGLQAQMPFPTPPEVPTETVAPARPMTEIERAIQERQKT